MVNQRWQECVMSRTGTQPYSLIPWFDLPEHSGAFHQKGIPFSILPMSTNKQGVERGLEAEE